MALKSQYKVGVVNEINLANTGVTFALNATTSSVLNCGGTSPAGLIFNSVWTGGNVSFNVCKTPNGTFVPLTNFDGSAYAIGVASGSVWIPLIPAMFCGVLYVELVCTVMQSTATSVDFALVPLFAGLQN